jgi:hypothetical protein
VKSIAGAAIASARVSAKDLNTGLVREVASAPDGSFILELPLGAIAYDQKSKGEKVHCIAPAHGPVTIVTAGAADLEIQFAGQTGHYQQVPFQLICEGKQTRIAATIPVTLSDFKIDPPALLTRPVRNEIPIRIEMTWHSEPQR